MDTLEYLTKSAEQIKENEKKTMRISRNLRDSLEKSVNEEVNPSQKTMSMMNPEPRPFERKVLTLLKWKETTLALADDETVWIFDDNKWNQVREFILPGLPQPG